MTERKGPGRRKIDKEMWECAKDCVQLPQMSDKIENVKITQGMLIKLIIGGLALISIIVGVPSFYNMYANSQLIDLQIGQLQRVSKLEESQNHIKQHLMNLENHVARNRDMIDELHRPIIKQGIWIHEL